MELKSISRLAELMAKHGLSELEIKENDTAIRLCRPVHGMAGGAAVVEEMPAGDFPAETAETEASETAPAEDVRYITAPMLGTFFSAATPEASALVSEGDVVTPETVVCIIEAMKVMNEIKAETSGTITKILVPNGSPVEFGQKLFEIR
ncbi:MAG: acetyl-CoA carboxylase biotin carboxyl carrier protein [Victivallales bacterium]|nr:acetyl-CoA carboxylase biotin carboxyl carrier protein [Victivallales bacterium]